MVEEAKRALATGHAVVIGLQATGEAAADAMALEPGEPCGWVSVTREMLLRFVDLHFPTQYEANPNGAASKTYLRPSYTRRPAPRVQALIFARRRRQEPSMAAVHILHQIHTAPP